jgi:predicted phosphodiesterase
MKKALVIGDAHIPFHGEKVLKLVLRYAKELDPDVIVMLGDMADCASFSKFTLPLLAPTYTEEKQIFLHEMKKFDGFKKKYLYGNHEYRIVDEYARNCRKVGTDMELRGKDIVSETLELDTLKNIEVVPYMGRIDLGSLTIKHGTYWRKDAGATAKVERLKEGGSTLSGHTHRMGSCPITLSGRTPRGIGAWENGCLCQQRVWYKRGNSVSDEVQDWQQGFSVVYYEDKLHGRFNVQQYYIIDGWFISGDGKEYKVK